MTYPRGLHQCLLVAVVCAVFLRVANAACNPETQYECQSGRCIPLYWRCDLKSNCENGEDEEGCDSVTCPSSYPYQCPTGKCIPNSWVCDLSLRQDCPGGEDQMNCNFLFECTGDFFQCHDTVCIQAYFRCDGQAQCPDGSDELGCGGEASCAEDEFMCNSGQCLPISKQCDQHPDCPGSEQEDEENCPGDRLCDEHSFRCDNGVCLLGYQRCDGADNCKYGEDELCGPRCHECDTWYDVTYQCHQSDYSHPSNCDAGMVCSSSLKKNFKGELVYTVGCKSNSYCSTQAANNPAACSNDPSTLGADEKCMFCCEGNYCNSYDALPIFSVGTATTKAPGSAGLQCYTCGGWSNAATSCSPTIETCGETEQCATTYKLNSRGKLVYIADCRTNFYCKGTHTGDAPCDVSTDKCIFCCDTEKCNSYDENPNITGARK